MNATVKPPVRREAMRIAGKLVSTDDMVEVRNPYDDSVVGLIPAARPEHVREAFAISDRVLVMKSGAIIEEGPPAAFSDHARLMELF